MLLRKCESSGANAGGRCRADYERRSLGELAAMAAVAALPATGVRSADGSAWRGAWRQGGTCGRRRRERMARSLGQQREQGCWVLAPSEERGRHCELCEGV